ncbi:hypothetical protein AAG570_000965 [Ranatra chinensis]|uniref:Tyrosine specific protein phosphatases domain-containing protein n=1 Tax=Ranatra chinensis TaxID=642074 RepID=A0ABD0YAH0_9HEMI
MTNNNQSGPGPVPNRWLYCPRKSTRLIAEKFLAFKTPLDSRFDEQVPDECRFTPSMLFESTRSYKHRIGLWIDLTNTTRFYNTEEVKNGYGDGSVAYSKVACKGHSETPSEEQATLFMTLCENFISRYPLKIIGVHCTHGFNRTGFLLVSYLVEKHNWGLEAALLEFSRARPPGIYKEDYLAKLYQLYGDSDDEVPQAPPRPDWCFEGWFFLFYYIVYNLLIPFSNQVSVSKRINLPCPILLGL